MRLLPLAVALFAGCAPPCGEVCAKIQRCEIDPYTTLANCRLSCERQAQVYNDEDSDDGDPAISEGLHDAFADHRRCITRSSCEELRGGACYDETLFPF